MPCYMRMYVYVWMCAFSFSGEIDSRVVEVTNGQFFGGNFHEDYLAVTERLS